MSLERIASLPARAWRALASLARLHHPVSTAAHAASVAAARLEVLLREQRLIARQLTLPDAALWQGGPPCVQDRVEQTLRSGVCRQEAFETTWFHRWMARLGHAPRYHRKLWEFAFIGGALEASGVLRPGARGLGFGVGREPLCAYFASVGCSIVATDLAPDAPGAAEWAGTGQFASGLEALRAPSVCCDGLFDAHVEFRTCDMNAIPADLRGFDFCWSACALEHLGSLDRGLAFVERSLDCLAPGGVAVHTTEFNIGPGHETLLEGPTVLYRRSDFENFAGRMAVRGVEVAPFDFDLGEGVLDHYVDLPPYLDAPHLRLSIEGFAATSIGLVIRKARR